MPQDSFCRWGNSGKQSQCQISQKKVSLGSVVLERAGEKMETLLIIICFNVDI